MSEDGRGVDSLDEEHISWVTVMSVTRWQAMMESRHTRDVSRHIKPVANATQQKVGFRVGLQERSRRLSVSGDCLSAGGGCNPTAMVSVCFRPNQTTYWKDYTWIYARDILT